MLELILVGVEPAELAEEDLPVQAERRRGALNLMTLATCFSWLPSVVFGNTVASVDVAAEDLADVERLLRRPARGADQR